jgi:putative glycosyltransferase (TIGR04348 family)
VTIRQEYAGENFDVLICLHATKSHESVRRFHLEAPGRPLIVALTGTDLYRDLNRVPKALKSLDMASHIVALQPKALEELPARHQKKARTIYQSVEPFGVVRRASTAGSRFTICVIGHLREVKDPFRAALASRLLPAASRIQIVQVGAAMTPAMAERARREMEINPRYRWVGERSRSQVNRILQSSALSLLSSRMEGGANVLGEAIVARVPVLSSRIAGSMGILGDDYPGYFTPGSTAEASQLIYRAETDRQFLRELARRCARLAPLFTPSRERAAWRRLLTSL